MKNNLKFSSVFAIVISLFIFTNATQVQNNIKLVDNGYEGIVIAINPGVPEDDKIITELTQAWTDASYMLFNATNQRVYFKEITILVPRSWNIGSYNKAERETYDTADVLIAEANPSYGNEPYTLQYGQCGEPGKYIHLTPTYVTDPSFTKDFGPKGKVMVHEWAHYRWGVFDESPTTGVDPFYYDSQQTLQATRCPASLTGIHVKPDLNGGYTSCQLNKVKGYPEDGCIFLHDQKQDPDLKASVMSHQYIDQVVSFCHNDPTDRVNQHNKEAPNEQNRLCNMQSVWEVIQTSPDINGTNQINKTDLTPTFNIVKACQNLAYVLVLDVSGSMSGSKFDDMVSVASIFITQYAASGSQLAIVEFESSATMLSIYLETVSDVQSRESLAAKLPVSAGGGTCIGCGIKLGLEILENYLTPGNCPSIIVLSDGGESSSYPMVRDVVSDVLATDTVVHSIFFGISSSSVNADQQQLTEDTGGIWFINDASDTTALLETFQSLSSTDNGDVYEQNFQIFSATHEISAFATATGKVSIDNTIGNQTAFVFIWTAYTTAVPYITLEAPRGSLYCTISTQTNICDASLASVDSAQKTITFSIPGTAEIGYWKYTIEASSYDDTVSIIVTSMASNRSVEPIVVESGMSETDISSLSPVVIYAKVTAGYNAVLFAEVVAKITDPNGKIESLHLYDEGSAPDVRKHDGVYSRYYTQYSVQGRYAVQVTVTGMGNNSINSSVIGSPATYNPGNLIPTGSVNLNPSLPDYMDITNGNGLSSSDIDSFSRVHSPGGFAYGGPIPGAGGTVDVFPPSKVINLASRQVNIDDVNEGIILTFSAPGEDYDNGEAQAYEIRYTYGSPSNLQTSFRNGILVTNDMLSQGDIHNPNVAGTLETFVINLINIPTAEDTITVGFAVQAYDKSSLSSEVSNIATMNFFNTPPVIPTTTTTKATTTKGTSTKATTTKTTSPKPIITTTTLKKEVDQCAEDLHLYKILSVSFIGLSFILLCVIVSVCCIHAEAKKYRQVSAMDRNQQMKSNNHPGPTLYPKNAFVEDF